MAQVKHGDTTVNVDGTLPSRGLQAPDFTLVANDLTDVKLSSFKGKNVVLNIFPSIDTRVCALSVREFNKRAAEADNTVVLCISKDLPFAMKRFCGAEGIDKIITLSDFRNEGFSRSYGVEMSDGKMRGLHARAVVVIDPLGKITYTELVPVIGQEPDYDSALHALK